MVLIVVFDFDKEEFLHLHLVSLLKECYQIIVSIDRNENPRNNRYRTFLSSFFPSIERTDDDCDRVCMGWQEGLFLLRTNLMADFSFERFTYCWRIISSERIRLFLFSLIDVWRLLFRIDVGRANWLNP